MNHQTSNTSQQETVGHDEPNDQAYWIGRCCQAFDSIDLAKFNADGLSSIALTLEVLAES